MANTNTASVTIQVNLTAPDTTPPTISITQPLANDVTNDTTPVIRGTAADNVGVTLVQVAIDSTTAYSNATGTTTWSFQAPTLAQGSHTVRAKATDAAGNVSTVATVVFTIDTTPPTINITSPTAGQVFNGSTVGGVNVPVSGTAVDNVSGISKIEIQVDGGTFQDLGITPSTGTTSVPFSTTVNITTSGSHTITIRATDGALVVANLAMSFVTGLEAGNITDYWMIGAVGAAVLLVGTKEGNRILNSVMNVFKF